MNFYGYFRIKLLLYRFLTDLKPFFYKILSNYQQIYLFIFNACTVNLNRFIYVHCDTLLKCFGELSQQLLYYILHYIGKKNFYQKKKNGSASV